MKKSSLFKKIVAVTVALATVVSICLPVSAQEAEYELGMPLDSSGVMVGADAITGTKVVTGIVKMIGGRAAKELSAYSIANDVPVLGNVFYLFCDPAQRAALKQAASIAQILQTVKDIREDIAALDSRISELNQKLDKNQAEIRFLNANAKVEAIGDKYTTAWEKYEEVLDCLEEYAVIAEQIEATTNESLKETLQLQGDAKLAEAEIALMYFAQAIENNDDIDFENDLANLNKAVWELNNDGTTYLGTLEGYLRESYPFEHMITELMYEGFQTVENMQLQIFTMYKEYINYKSYSNPEAYVLYGDEYFTGLYETLVENVNAQAEGSGIGELMIPDPFTEAELEEMFGEDTQPELPDDIAYTTSILGTEYSAYRVRENKTLSYFLILTEKISGSTAVKKYSCDYTTKIDTGKDIYRPTFVLEGRYTDDGRFRMINSAEEMQFALGWTNLISTLRDTAGCNLVNIPQGTTHIMLYSDNCVPNNFKDTYWKMSYQNAEDLSESAASFDSNSIYGGACESAIAVYKDTSMDSRYTENNTWVANDKGLIENQTILVGDGQTLDISSITVNADNVTIIVSGEGKIISNPDITLTNSQVIITGTEHGDYVFVTDLNVAARDYQEAALVVKTDCTIGFEGNNSFSGKSSEVSREDIYKYYVYGKPAMASHGILVEDYATFVGVKDGVIALEQSIKATGAGGGAGICIDRGALDIRYMTVNATGSEVKLNDSLSSQTEDLYSIGAGIGASVSCAVGNSGSFSVNKDKRIESKGDSTLNGAIGVFTYLADITAKGIKSSSRIAISDSYLGDTIYSEDIGGVKMSNGNYYCFRNGALEDSKVAAKNLRISSRIVTKNSGNLFDPEVYKITTYTKGSNGVTTDGVYFKVNGEEGSTDWMYASSCGNDKGDWSGTVKGISVGKINSITVKTSESNHWYPGKITVEGTFGGETITVYGGRWIGTDEQTLSPDDNVYEVVIKTADCNNAGTDANISLYLEDAKGNVTTKQDLSDIHQDKNAFEKGDQDTFWIYAPDGFEKVENTYISSDYANSAAGWKLEYFTVKKVSGKFSDNGYTFYSGQWFEEERTIQFGKNSGGTGAFYVEVKTQDASNAGTDSNIYLTIYGDKGNTGEINLGTYAGNGNDFEKGDLDCFNIGYDTKGIGTINKIVIRKDDAGSGPDWKAAYIDIHEEVADGQPGQAVRFNINKKLSDSTYTFTTYSAINRKVSRIDREMLEDIEQVSENEYFISVDRNVSISESIFDYLIEKEIKLTVEMTDGDKALYAVTFDGAAMEDSTGIALKKSYLVSDGYAVMDFIKDAPLPAGTSLKLYLENLGFDKGDNVVVLSKDSDGNWTENMIVGNEDGCVVVTIEEGKQLLLNLSGAEVPDLDNPETDGESGIVYMVCVAALLLAVVVNSKRKGAKR